MKLLPAYLALILVSLAGCDGPTRIRSPTTSASLRTGTPTSGTTSSGTTGGTDTTTTTGTTTGTTTTLPAGFESCNTNASYYNATIGYVSLCQSATNELSFRVGYTVTDQSDGTCIVPMFKDTSGNSTYLGSAQCTKHNANQVVYGNVSKNRTGHSSYPVNSVMVLKYSGTTAFNQCMQAYDIKYAACRASACAPYSYNATLYNQCLINASATCDSEAKKYMTSACNSFKASTPYIQITTK